MKAWAIGPLAVGGYALAFAVPYGAAGILVALPCIFLLGRLSSPRKVFYGGLALGVALYAPHLFFFVHVFGRSAVLLFLIAGFPIAVFLLLLHFARKHLWPVGAFLLTPVLWTGIEFFRSELYQLRFAWLLPGQAAVFLPGIRWLCIGVYGVGFIRAFVSAMVISPWWKLQTVGVLASIAIAVSMYWPPLAAVDLPSPLHVAGIQLESPDESTVADALDRLAQAHPEAQILVLSEYTFGGSIPASARAVVKKYHRYLVAGGIQSLDDTRFRDTAFVIGPDGEDVFSQAKSVPVQFMADGLPADHREVWHSPWGKIGIAVCYDLSYARVMDDFVRQGARGLIVPTMDLAKWGEYERRMLHGRMAPTRSAEYRIPIFGVWSSGVSQLTDRTGRVIATAGYPGQGEMIAGPFDLASPGHVPPDRWCAFICSIATGLFALYLLLGRLIGRTTAATSGDRLPQPLG
jgi:apolipoprotein N-acyltransferase